MPSTCLFSATQRLPAPHGFLCSVAYTSAAALPCHRGASPGTVGEQLATRQVDIAGRQALRNSFVLPPCLLSLILPRDDLRRVAICLWVQPAITPPTPSQEVPGSLLPSIQALWKVVWANMGSGTTQCIFNLFSMYKKISKKCKIVLFFST